MRFYINHLHFVSTLRQAAAYVGIVVQSLILGPYVPPTLSLQFRNEMNRALGHLCAHIG